MPTIAFQFSKVDRAGATLTAVPPHMASPSMAKRRSHATILSTADACGLLPPPLLSPWVRSMRASAAAKASQGSTAFTLVYG